MTTRRPIRHPVFGTNPVPFGRVAEWKLKDRPDALRISIHKHSRNAGGFYVDDVTACVWNTREAMLRAARIEEQVSYGMPSFYPLIKGEVK